MSWSRWGPYLSERQWGTVREDYSEDGNAWAYFPFEMASSRAYRWGEDGIGGVSDDKETLCFAFSFWNEKDPILKERFFGLSNEQGNHGEDVKEYYYYLDNTPTHSYMSMLYKYPQEAYPYEKLKNHGRSKDDPELELIDTGVFKENRYFDLFLEYAKEDPENLLIRCTPFNRGKDEAPLHVLPTLWLRNTWVWKKETTPGKIYGDKGHFRIEHPRLGTRYLYFEGSPAMLFTENVTNAKKLFQEENSSPYTKDAFDEAVVRKNDRAVNPAKEGTKAALHYMGTSPIRLRLADRALENPFSDFDEIFKRREDEANDFWDKRTVKDPEKKKIQRQAWAGLLWSKQYYHYIIEEWLTGDELVSKLPEKLARVRNTRWRHFYSDSIISMPDKWEYPWFASWDTAFQAVSMAHVDIDFAKNQLLILFNDSFMHPSGQIPAYEWDFENINPPIFSWAALYVYRHEEKTKGKRDSLFLQKIFQKLVVSFTWWINRKDPEERGIFEGGFLGMDNISLFNRSAKLPSGIHLIQSDATSWMAMFCLHLSSIALELNEEEMAAKFFGIFLYIGEAIHTLWDEEDRFYYDHVEIEGGKDIPIKIHSYVGLIPLLSVGIFTEEKREKMKDYAARFRWLREHRPHLFEHIADLQTPGVQGNRLFSLVSKERLQSILSRMLDANEFLSPYGIRALSRYHHDHPCDVTHGDYHFHVEYEPAETTSQIFGGNSNWRGPIWFPINFLLIQALEEYALYYGDSFKVQCGSRSLTLKEIAAELARRLISLFEKDSQGHRPVYDAIDPFQKDPHFKDYLLFYEYFNGDTGQGLGASHQTGWTSLVAPLIEKYGKEKG